MLQNYNKIMTTYPILNYTTTKHRSKSPQKFAYFTHPNFSKAKIEKSVQITRANTVHLSVNTVVCFVMGGNGGSELSITFNCMNQKDLVGKKSKGLPQQAKVAQVVP